MKGTKKEKKNTENIIRPKITASEVRLSDHESDEASELYPLGVADGVVEVELR
jgi:hypothetical protein